MKRILNGIEVTINPRGLVLWASDWTALYAMARRGESGLRLEHLGPACFGDVLVIAGKVA